MPGRSPTAVLCAAAIALAAVAAPARAHQTSVKYVDVTVEGRRATVPPPVAPGDVTEPLGLAPDARPTVAEAAVPAVAAYVAGWLPIVPAAGADAGPGAAIAPCPAGRPEAAPAADARFVVVRWQVACAADLARIALDFRAFFAVDARHEAFVTVHGPDGSGQAQAVVVRA